jgi:osmotically-inducible protein OsmY
MRTTLKTHTKNALLLTLAMALIGGVGCASTRTTGEQLDDAGITSKITAKLTSDPEINPFNIDVDTLDGVVTLRGEVEKEKARTEAEHHARSTKGVVEVKNDIRVVSEAAEDDESGSDAWITTKIKAKITGDSDLSPFNINVDTKDGVVTLRGAVKSAGSKQEAGRIASDTSGVVRVDNMLEVEAGE